MANGVNKVILVGNLGKDPEVRFVASGNAVCNLRVATTERRKDGEEWKDHTEWHDVVVFGKTAENVGQYLSRGSQVYVEGRNQTRQFKDKEGVEKWRTEVIAHNVVFLGGKGGGESKPAPASSGTTNGQATGTESQGFIEEDLPF